MRTYPVYMPGQEPKGYWQMLQSKKPEPLITPGARTQGEWIPDGKRVFREMDVPGFRTCDAKFIAKLKGLALSISECSGCHGRIMPDGSQLDGAGATREDGVWGKGRQSPNSALERPDAVTVVFLNVSTIA